jgi:chromosome segregation ATPase
MFDFLKKKKKEAAEEETPTEEASADGEDGDKKAKKESAETPANLTAISTEVDRLKASVESFSEVRKSFSERFSQINEQIGELRAMIMDRDRTIQEVELKAVKAADMVETVQPEKLMIEIQKENAKFEALKANLEGHEAMVDRVMDELKELRRKFEFFRGVEEVIKLSEEVKKELIEIKKVEADIHINTEKMQSMYSEIRKKYQGIDELSDQLSALRAAGEQHTKDIDFLKGKLTGVAEKEDLDKMAASLQKTIGGLKDATKTSAISKDVAELKGMLEMIKK